MPYNDYENYDEIYEDSEELKENMMKSGYFTAVEIDDTDKVLFHKTPVFNTLEDLKKYQLEQIDYKKSVLEAAAPEEVKVGPETVEKVNLVGPETVEEVSLEGPETVEKVNIDEPVYEYVINSPEYMAAGPDAQQVRVASVSLSEIPTQDDQARSDRIGWLFSLDGVVYRFDRGIVMIDQDGVKVEDIFDGTTNHHSDRIHFVAQNSFGVDIVTDVGPVQRSVEAADNGLTTLMLEGSRCYIFLPAEITETAIDQIISEVEPRDFVYLLARGEDNFTDSLTREDVLEYLNHLKEKIRKQEEQDNLVEEEILSARQSYVNALMKYIRENGMTLNDYFTMLGESLLSGDLSRVPEFERKNPFLTQDDINRLLDSDEDRIVEYFANAMTRVIELNLEQMEEKKPEKEDEELENAVREAYIRLLMRYINERGITLEEYYRLLAVKLRNGDTISIPRFEGVNPFLSEEDIRLLLDEQDERIVDYFAQTMARVIELNLEQMNINNNDKPFDPTNDNPVDNNTDNDNQDDDDKDNDRDFNFNNLGGGNHGGPGGPNNPDDPNGPEDDDELDLDEMSYLDDKSNYMSGIKITYINTDLINQMNGLAVIREPRTGRINIYGYEHEDINLAGKKVIENSESNIESGYYVNLSEYVGILAHGIEEQYGEDSNFAFVNDEGEYLNFYDVINNIMATCRSEGALRYGKEYKDTSFDSYEELEQQYTGNRGVFKGIELTKGLYVRRDILIDELNKYRVAITKENIDNISHSR